MSYSHDRYDRQRRQTYGSSTRRSALGYWVPLALTVTIATVGLAAWIWSERRDDDEEDYDRGGGHGDGQPPSPTPGDGVGDAAEAPYARGEDPSMMARMSGALRRTPSPQQIFDGASRKVAAGVAAAGAVVGGALSSIREEDKGDFEDHSRWSEEAESRSNGADTRKQPDTRALDSSTAVAGPSRQPATAVKRSGGTRRKTVAIVISAESSHESDTQDDPEYHQEHAVMLLIP